MINAMEIKWDVLGATLASLDDEAQALFFKGFIHELKSFDTNYQSSMQMAFINGKMDDATRDGMREFFGDEEIWKKEPTK